MTALAPVLAPVLTLVPSEPSPGADDALDWFTAGDLAAMALPGLPATKRRINMLAAERGWAKARDARGRRLARRALGPGGGLEYHRTLLPAAALLALARRCEPTSAPPVAQPETPSPSSPWARYEALSEAVRAQAERRLEVLQAVEQLEAGGLTACAAIAAVSGQRKLAAATLWNWRRLVAGVAAGDRLPALAPTRRGGGAQAEIDPRSWAFFRSAYLRLEGPTLAACYGWTVSAAEAGGWGPLPHLKTFGRRLRREQKPSDLVLAREGDDAHRRCLPAQKRSVADLHALKHVNIDGHKWDVFVRWPDGRIGRAMMVAIQDLFSRKCLAWRVCETENAQDVRLCFADLFKHWGIPDEATLDNGRGFASKWITGGTANRFRFKVKPGDPEGLLTSLGVEVHWTLPYRGQSKPIERMFKDFCGRIAKHPAFAGAYVGNNPTAKPENYGSRAIPIDEFRRVVDQEIRAHNAREGRDTEMGRGVHSFDEVFKPSYEAHPIRRATPEQLRLALLASEALTADRKSGAVTLYGNTFWGEPQLHLAGQRLVARFDPDALQTEVHLYDLAGRYLLSSPVWGATGFSDAGAAKARARLEADHRRKGRAALDAEQRLTAAELTALLPAPPEPEPLSPKVIRPVRTRPSAVGLALAKIVNGESTESDADAGHPPTDGRSPAPRRAPLIDRLADHFERPVLRLVE